MSDAAMTTGPLIRFWHWALYFLRSYFTVVGWINKLFALVIFIGVILWLLGLA